MDFVDGVIVRLAREDSRVGLFDDVALAQIVASSYDTSSIGADPPFAIVFDSLQLLFDTSSIADLSGTLNLSSGAPNTAHVEIRGLGNPGPRIDALWTGAVVASSSVGMDRITSVDVRWPDVSRVDASIGTLPTDPVALENLLRA